MGRINHKMVAAHRVLWAMSTGSWPRNEIDHINGDPSDNRLSNLRECTSRQNKMNQAAHKDGRSKFKGVNFSKYAGKWKAEIKIGPARRHLGYFASEVDAAAAYDEAAREFHGSFARPNIHDGAV